MDEMNARIAELTKARDERDAALASRRERIIDIVFDGPPSHVSGRFVEVEDEQGRGINVGEWIQRADGYWVLRFTALDADGGGEKE